MHVIAWLLTQRAVHNGELRWSDLANPRHHLGEAAASDTEVVGRFPFAARALISASEDLYERVARLQSAMHDWQRSARPAGKSREHVARSAGKQLLILMPGSFGRKNGQVGRSEEHTSELQSLMSISYADFCLN